MFGEGDFFLVEQFNRNMADGMQMGDKRYGIQLVLADTQSDPMRASQVAKDLTNGEAIDLVLAPLNARNGQSSRRCLQGGGYALPDDDRAVRIILFRSRRQAK